MEICSIASGSSGNCICAGTQNCHLMIDAGISGKRIEAVLARSEEGTHDGRSRDGRNPDHA